jgi:hypothetical protein
VPGAGGSSGGPGGGSDQHSRRMLRFAALITRNREVCWIGLTASSMGSSLFDARR